PSRTKDRRGRRDRQSQQQQRGRPHPRPIGHRPERDRSELAGVELMDDPERRREHQREGARLEPGKLEIAVLPGPDQLQTEYPPRGIAAAHATMAIFDPANALVASIGESGLGAAFLLAKFEPRHYLILTRCPMSHCTAKLTRRSLLVAAGAAV